MFISFPPLLLHLGLPRLSSPLQSPVVASFDYDPNGDDGENNGDDGGDNGDDNDDD